jgi:hypothetical protein
MAVRRMAEPPKKLKSATDLSLVGDGLLLKASRRSWGTGQREATIRDTPHTTALAKIMSRAGEGTPMNFVIMPDSVRVTMMIKQKKK